MKATELRIGNFINNELTGEGKLTQEVLCDFANGYIHLEPIPLTEEWLLKFGYSKFIENDTYSSLSLVIDNVLKYTILLEHENNEFTFPNTYKPIKLKHVHQLQNLFHSLTGEELKTK